MEREKNRGEERDVDGVSSGEENSCTILQYQRCSLLLLLPSVPALLLKEQHLQSL